MARGDLLALVLLSGAAFVFDITSLVPERVYGSDGCTQGTDQGCAIGEIFLLPHGEDLDYVERFQDNIANVRDGALMLLA